jgi:hypothetical protein
MRDRTRIDRPKSGSAPFALATHLQDLDLRDQDRPTRVPPHDPLTDAFGDTFWSANWQLDGVLDEKGGKKFFARCYATEPCRVLVDIYRTLPNPAYYQDEVVPEAIANLREHEIAKAEKIAAQIKRYNSAHPEARYGLIQMIGDDVIQEVDVARSAEGEIISPSAGVANRRLLER